MTRGWLAGLVGALGLAAFACRPAGVPVSDTAGPPWFEDVTERLGLAFTHDAGPGGSYFLPEIMGSGVALFDADGDGRLDLFLLQNAGPKSSATHRFFRQQSDGRFADATATSGLGVVGHGMGAAVGDVDNDGRPDLLVTEYGGVRLFHNRGGAVFTDITGPSGLVAPVWATAGAFLDYDRDGLLDLVVVCYVDLDPDARCRGQGALPDYCHPKTYSPTASRLFRNRGRGPEGVPRFEDVSLSSGLGRKPGAGLGVACLDLDGDGWVDIFIAHDARANHLWLNNRDGTFREDAVARGVAYNGLGQTQGNMGVAPADLDGDGLPDLFVTHLTEESHTFWRQGPPGLFRDATTPAGLASPRWRGTGFGTIAADFDCDGRLDLAVVNGRVSRPATAPRAGGFTFTAYAERNQFFTGTGGGRFADRADVAGPFTAVPGVWRGLAVGDLGGDGAPDLVATQVAGPARAFRNVAPARGHWLRVRALDPKLRRDALGARVTMEANGRRRVGWVHAAGSYLSSSDPRVHFGLGEVAHYESLRVLWPDGTEEAFVGGVADRDVVARKGEGRTP